MGLHIVHHPDYDARFSPVHRFPMSKYSALLEALGEKGLLEQEFSHRPGVAHPAWLRLAHHATYVDQVLAARVPEPIERAIGFAVDERVSRRAQLASGGTVLAARLALQHGLACNAAGGSHHARRAQGAGYCTFNDVGVAASLLLSGGEAEHLLVVDLDVHQGDGTADIFADNPAVTTFSMHGERNYPHRKIASDIDIALPDGTGDDAYLETLDDALEKLKTAAPQPDLVFYNAGVDPHADDRLGRLALTSNGLARRDGLVFNHFRARDIPVCGVVGGGYGRDITALAARHAILFEVANEFV